jgi:predicted RNase H-related nuclease YkuK (DUF458 family)
MKPNDDIDKTTWHRASNNSEISFDDIIKEIEAHRNHTIHVGTDSHHSRMLSRRFIFSTTICLYLEGKGGFYFFYRKTPKIKYTSLAARLTAEVNRSVNVANQIQELISNRQISVHVDVNKDVKFKSGKFCPMFKSWVESLGFVYIPKPDSWASTGVADRHAK